TLEAVGFYDQTDAFVARFHSNGALAWAVRAGGEGEDKAQGVAALPDGSCVVTGWFARTATFGEGEANETVLEAAGGSSGGVDDHDLFIARYAPDGTLAWARRAGADGDDVGWDVAVQDEGTALVVGSFEGFAVFGQGETNHTLLESAGWFDVFVARYVI
ncbi:MAG: hypothetical protein JRI55_29465, partial [Deltaproteobacteria bacterium]|nr:hypothetical protein [Deltaproteobacteria bacterium]